MSTDEPRIYLPLLLVAVLAGCGGDGSGAAPPSTPTNYSVAGEVNGLSGTLVLQNNAGDDLSLSANGAFSFPILVPHGSTFRVTIATDPAFQRCGVTNGQGPISSNVSDVTVACADSVLVSTFASTPTPSGGAFDASGNLWVTDAMNNIVRSISPSGVVNIVTASIPGPAGVSNVSGQMFVAATGDNRIYRVEPNGTLHVFAGSGASASTNGVGVAASFNRPFGLASDAAGNLYVSEVQGNFIRKVSVGGLVTTLAGNGVAGFSDGLDSTASFNQPSGLAVDSGGNVLVADLLNNRIRTISQNGLVSTLAGSGAAGSANGSRHAASFNGPHDLDVGSDGAVYVADEGGNTIRRILPNGDVSTLAGTGAPGSTDGAGNVSSFNQPSGVVIDALDRIYVMDWGSNAVRQIVRN